MSITRRNLSDLSGGDVLLTKVLAINKVKGDPTQGKKLQLEIAEHVRNPHNNASSLAGALNQSDARFGKTRPRRGYQSAEPAEFFALFGHYFSDEEKKKMMNLQVHTGKGGEANWKKDIDFVEVNILNPKTSEGIPIALKILENNTPASEGQKFKAYPNLRADGSANPRAGQPITTDGKKVYSHVSVDFCTVDKDGQYQKPSRIFLKPDAIETPTGLTVEQARQQMAAQVAPTNEAVAPEEMKIS